MKKGFILLAGIAAILFTSCGGLADELLKEEEKNNSGSSKPDFSILPDSSSSFILPDEYDGKDCFLIYYNTTNENIYNNGDKIQNFSQNNNKSRSAGVEDITRIISKNAVYLGDGAYRDEVHYELPEELKKLKKNNQKKNNSRTAYNSSSNTTYYNPDLTDSLQIGDKVNFYYDETENNIGYDEFTLKKIGNKCRIWVLDPSAVYDYNEIASTIDKNYNKVTSIFGSNIFYGDETTISADDTTKLEVLIYDIYGDATPDQTGGVFGFFRALDFYNVSYLTSHGYNSYSNECQLINIDSMLLKNSYKKTLSTLIHEFQHLLNFCNKYDTETWFTEMLSMSAEDIFLTQIGLGESEGPMNRLAQGFFGKPYQGFGNWHDDDSDPEDAVYYSYANAYAFGAFLMRNFGGIKLIHDIATNDYYYFDEDAITLALQNLEYDNESFYTVFLKFAMTYIFPEENQCYSFNKQINQKINNVNYTLKAIDLDNDYFNCGTFPGSTEDIRQLNFEEWAKNNIYLKNNQLKYGHNNAYTIFAIKGPKIFKKNYVLADPIEKYGFAVYYLGKGEGGKTYNITRSVPNLIMALVAK